jgi:hypothetical protein
MAGCPSKAPSSERLGSDGRLERGRQNGGWCRGRWCRERGDWCREAVRWCRERLGWCAHSSASHAVWGLWPPKGRDRCAALLRAAKSRTLPSYIERILGRASGSSAAFSDASLRARARRALRAHLRRPRPREDPGETPLPTVGGTPARIFSQGTSSYLSTHRASGARG